MLLGATEYTLCCTIQFTFQFIPDSTGWGLYSLITCSCQNTTSESHYFKFYHTRHLLFYLAIFFILPYPKPIIDCDSHKSLCCFPQEEIYRMEGRSGKNINQCWIILRSFLFLLFFSEKNIDQCRTETQSSQPWELHIHHSLMCHIHWVSVMSYIFLQILRIKSE